MSIIRVLVASAAGIAFAVLGATAQAQTYRGIQSCGGSECHTKSGEINWLETKPGGREHRASLGRLKASMDISVKYAKAVELDDVFAPKGMCLKCHGSYIETAKVPEGVGCEGCHGPAANYRDAHAKTPKDYAAATGRGMRDLKGKPGTWSRVCRDCHILDKPEYEPLIEAGHKEGNRWKVQDKYVGVQAHWKRIVYTSAQVLAAKPIVVADANETSKPEPEKPEPPKPEPPTGELPKREPPKPEPPKPLPKADPRTKTSPDRVTREEPPKPPDPLPPVPPDPVPVPTPRGAGSPLALPAPVPVTPSELFAVLQTKVAGYLVRLLEGATQPAQPLKPLPTARLSGPDAQFLQLQAEVLALAIDALNAKKPAPNSTGK